jgi:hypothetical protein
MNSPLSEADESDKPAQGPLVPGTPLYRLVEIVANVLAQKWIKEQEEKRKAENTQ